VPRLLRIEVGHVEAGRQRQDCGRDAAAVHLVEGGFKLPVLHERRIADTRLLPSLQQELREEMMMHIDPVRRLGR